MSETDNKLAIVWEQQVVEGVEISLPKVNLHPLQPYERLRTQLLDVDQRTGPLFMRDLMYAFEAVSKLAARIQEKMENAKTECDHEYAKAVLHRATAYLKEQGLKDTAELRKLYGDMDVEYRMAKEKFNALRALYEIINTKAEAFRMAHDDAKKIYDKVTSGPMGREKDTNYGHSSE